MIDACRHSSLNSTSEAYGMDILLGGGSNSELGKLLSGKNAGLLITLLPVLLQLLGSRSSGQSGLESILGGLTSGGLGDVVNSWVGGGPNKAITPAQVKKGLGPKALKQISAQSGLPAGDVTKGLSQLLPVLVNHLTPQAQVPNASSLDSALAGLAGLLPRS
jgi:uncharacterized protein YidB (DUF937 family)